MFENMAIPPEHTIRAIYYYLHTLNIVNTPKRIATKWEMNIIEKLQLRVTLVHTRSGKWFRWSAEPRS